MEQEALSRIIAENLTKYRKIANYTQLEVAEKLNYSDKSVSKWEQGNGMPDIFVLQQMAEMYGVTVNDFLSEKAPNEVPVSAKKKDNVSRIIIMSMSAGLCWLVAVVIYVFLGLFDFGKPYSWLAFVYAVPATFIVLLVLSCVWKFRVSIVLCSSALVWTILLGIFLTAEEFLHDPGLLFVIGVPLQILLCLWFGFRYRIIKIRNKVSKK